jgi:hypothetical protein
MPDIVLATLLLRPMSLRIYCRSLVVEAFALFKLFNFPLEQIEPHKDSP